LKIAIVGGGPAGLYFGLLMKKQDPAHEITIYERNRADDTFGWGVVFSDETVGRFSEKDPESHQEITREFAWWSDIDIHFRGTLVRSTGHGFCGLARRTLLGILQRRCAALGVRLLFEHEIADADALLADHDLVLAADGVNSRLREAQAGHFGTSLEWSGNKFCWLGTDLRLSAFTFIFRENEHGLFQVHAYPFDAGRSTFIVECREEVWRRAGLDAVDEAGTVAYLERLFAPDLQGHRLLTNRSLWRTFPTVRNRTWRHGRVLLIGDAAHTAHFSIGSGTKLAMEDAIALAEAFGARPDVPVPEVLAAYEAERHPEVSRVQAAARTSLEWFENTPRHMQQEPLELAFSLLTRSKRITYAILALRDPALVARVTEAFAAHAGGSLTVPPALQPFRLRSLRLRNRIVVGPMCQYSAVEGTPGDWHLVHLGSRALGGAALVFAEATHVAPEARISPYCAGLYTDAHTAAWRRIVDFAHQYSGALIGLQIGHAGRKGACARPWEGGEPLREGGWELLAPSAIPFDAGWPVPREMTRHDMDVVREQFARSAERAAEAGFDALEIHMAHGYLLATFLSPLTNRRQDDFGGTIEGRMRFPLEVFDAVRARWPAERPLLVRISATDWKDGGFDSADRVALARALKDHGGDAIDVSTGGTVPDQQPVYGRMFNVKFSEEIRLAAGIPTLTVGNLQGVDHCNTILAAGRADLCVMARPHLADPYLTLHAAVAANQDEDYWPPQYLAARRPKA
jgi:anthraniloyl-CoA monooxygenase